MRHGTHWRRCHTSPTGITRAEETDVGNRKSRHQILFEQMGPGGVGRSRHLTILVDDEHEMFALTLSILSDVVRGSNRRRSPEVAGVGHGQPPASRRIGRAAPPIARWPMLIDAASRGACDTKHEEIHCAAFHRPVGNCRSSPLYP